MTGKAPQDRRKAAAARATVAEPTFEALDLDAEPAAPDTATVHLFTLNGVDYYVPKTPAANVSLRYLRMAREDAIGAQGWLLEQLIGVDGYTALMEWDGLQAAHLRQLLAVVQQLAVDATEGTRGPLGRG